MRIGDRIIAIQEPLLPKLECLRCNHISSLQSDDLRHWREPNIGYLRPVFIVVQVRICENLDTVSDALIEEHLCLLSRFTPPDDVRD